jgi:hypothetical protein
VLLTLHARAARDRRRHARRGGTRRRVTVARAPVRGGANGARRSRTTECCADHGRDPRRVIRRGLGTDAAILGVFCVVNFARTTGRSSACSARRDLRRVLRLDLRADHGRDRRCVLRRELFVYQGLNPLRVLPSSGARARSSRSPPIGAHRT